MAVCTKLQQNIYWRNNKVVDNFDSHRKHLGRAVFEWFGYYAEEGGKLFHPLIPFINKKCLYKENNGKSDK